VIWKCTKVSGKSDATAFRVDVGSRLLLTAGSSPPNYISSQHPEDFILMRTRTSVPSTHTSKENVSAILIEISGD
jgi:hypothetical protein